MTEQDFQNLVRGTNLSATSREAARLVFVEGWSQTDAGAEIGLSKQRMTQIVKVVRTAEQKQKEEAELALLRGSGVLATGAALNVAAVEASYAMAVKAARDVYGDDADVKRPNENGKSIGEVLSRTDFHLVQSVGRGAVVIHELSKLDRVPLVGRQVAIDYLHGRGSVTERMPVKERERGGASR
ncbi:KfrB domain-containing protein [Paracidovorax citrulli]